MRRLTCTTATTILLALAVLCSSAGASVVEQVHSGQLSLVPDHSDFESATLQIVGPNGYTLHESFAAGESISVDLVHSASRAVRGEGEETLNEPVANLADGRYRYELRVMLLDGTVETSGGVFMATSGLAMSRDAFRAQLTETRADLVESGAEAESAPEGGLHTKRSATLSEADWIAISDGVNDGLTHLSIDSDSPSNNLYFHLVNNQGDLDFEETTTFPPTGSGASRLFLNRGGNIGIGTRTPARDLEISSTTPTLRLTDTDGFEWNLNDNPNSNQFDIVSTAAGVSPTRHVYINRAAPADQLILQPAGIGIGTFSPSATVEIEGSSGTSQFLIDEQGANASVEVMFNLVCNCSPGFRMQNTVNGEIWFFRHTSAGDFSFDNVGSAGLEARLDSNGNFFIQGSLSQGSSRTLKQEIDLSDGATVLDRVRALDVYEWSYIDQRARHFGPMAEEFYDAFGFGESRERLAPGDVAGVALAAVKALQEENEELRAKLDEVLSRLDEELEHQGLDGVVVGSAGAGTLQGLLRSVR